MTPQMLEKRRQTMAQRALERAPARFWKLVDKRGPEDCWEWLGKRTEKNYGRFTWPKKKNVRAHRVAFFLTHGKWPKENCLHSCDNRPCCNPSHLSDGSQQENLRQAFERKRMKAPPRLLGEDNPKSKFTNDQAKEIITLRNSGISPKELSLKFNVPISSIYCVCRRKNMDSK
jgi:hypothetical protein